jgi:hypothetical protein
MGPLTVTMLVFAAVIGLILVTRRRRGGLSGRNDSSGGDLAGGDFGGSVHGLFDGQGHSAASGGSDAGDAGGGGGDGGGGDGGGGGD